MKKLFLLLILLQSIFGFSQEKFTVSGYIKDQNTGETIIGATIVKANSNTGTITNGYGYFTITLPKGENKLIFSYIGYQNHEEKLLVTKNTTLNINMAENSEALDAVVFNITTEKVAVKKAEMSVNKLKVETIKEIPAVLGEVDVLKSITTLPGVTTAGEGQSGFNVRGGGADQNLVLLDEATIYNTSHLFGLFSVINADAIKDIKLYKGGIPAIYGGRVSSVLDVYLKDGNSKEFHGNGGIGLISSRLSLEGPIQKDKSSFFIAGRRSYADLFIPLVMPENKNKAYFYDLNTKLNWEINDKNKLFASGYFGRDVFALSSSFVNTYGNALGNVRWNHIFNPKLFSNLSVIYSDYYYGLILDIVGFEWKSGLKNLNLKYDFTQYKNENITFNYGTSTTSYEFNPGKIEPNSAESGITTDQLPKKYALETGTYFDVEHKLNNQIDLRYGLRWSNFLSLGENEFKTYATTPVVFNDDIKIYESATPVSTKNYKISDVLKTYNNLEPRFSIAYSLNGNNAFKASYQRIVQYLHLISNTQSPSPLDIWTSSNQYLKPQISNQVAFGYQSNLTNNWSLTSEVFGKLVKNRLDYIDGANLVAQEAIETVVLAGKSRAYGFELMLKKEEGKVNGWISYTLSKSEQQTPGRNATETGINNGHWYATAYNKTHDLTLITNYKPSKKWNFSSSFKLQSGQPVTYPIGSYQYLGITIPEYGLRNANNLPMYHRLDVGATYHPKKYENTKYKAEWVFSVYNLYNRKNTSSIIFGQNPETGVNTSQKLAIFGILPSISYNFKF